MSYQCVQCGNKAYASELLAMCCYSHRFCLKCSQQIVDMNNLTENCYCCPKQKPFTWQNCQQITLKKYESLDTMIYIMKNRVEVNIYSLNYSYKHLVSDCFNNIARKQLKYHPPINQIVFKMYGLNRLEAKQYKYMKQFIIRTIRKVIDNLACYTTLTGKTLIDLLILNQHHLVDKLKKKGVNPTYIYRNLDTSQQSKPLFGKQCVTNHRVNLNINAVPFIPTLN